MSCNFSPLILRKIESEHQACEVGGFSLLINQLCNILWMARDNNYDTSSDKAELCHKIVEYSIVIVDISRVETCVAILSRVT